MPKILITGSAGFLGANLVRHILSNYKLPVIGIDRLDNIACIHNVYMNKSSEFYLADCRDYNILNRIFELNKPDYVIHLAETKAEPGQTIDGFYNIIQACRLFGIKKLLFVSSVKVYDKAIPGKKTETSRTDPEWYADDVRNSVKMSNESILKSQANGFIYNIARPAEIFGPRNHAGILPQMFIEMKNNGKISLPNKGNIIRDILHVEDFCAAIMLILLGGGKNEIYNVSGGVDFTDLEIANMVRETVIGSKGIIEFSDKTIDDPYIEVDATKLRELGWKPTRKFKDRVKDTLLWYSNNSWFFR